MCGICGKINFNGKPVEESIIRAMMKKIKHRGPDDEGVLIDNNYGFGFVRLSILDLSPQGHQPMFDDTGRYMIIHNGEVYNYIELRDDLQGLGHRFRSSTDSEVLLHSFIEWGESCLHKLNGMFAFAIYDKQTKNIFAARDRYGIKPFYLYQDKNQLVFSSEIKSILVLKLFVPSINDEVVFNYFNFSRTDYGTATFFREINKLGHGEKMWIRNGKVEINRWYKIGDYEGLRIDDKKQFRQSFISSVKLRLRSDVPYGVCLSGGLDSGSIVRSIVEDLNERDINTFSSVFKVKHRANENAYIDELTKDLKNVHKVYTDADSLLDDLFDIIETHPEPFTTSAIYAQYKVMDLAKKNGVTVLLDGQGADEYLCGYHYFYGFYYKELFMKLKWFTLIKEMVFEYSKTKSLYGIKSFVYFLLPKSFKTKTIGGKNPVIKSDFYQKHITNSKIINNLHSSKNLQEAIANHFEYKLEHLLKWEDINSMRFSIESRVPFLDFHLVEGVYRAASSHKIKNGLTKFILREAMAELLPKSVLFRKDKIGFATPQEMWFRSDRMKKLFKEQCLSNANILDNYIDRKVLEEKFHKHIEGNANHSGILWKALNFKLWYQNTFIH